MYRITSSLILACLLLPGLAGTAQAEDCDATRKLAARVWKQYEQQAHDLNCIVPGKKGPARFAACTVQRLAVTLSESMVGWWNSSANNEWRTLGARSVGPEWQPGAVVGPTDRRFTALAPAASETTLQFQKRDGRGKAEITVCAFTEAGRATRIRQFEVASGDDNDGRRWSIDLRDAGGKVVTVMIDGKSVAKRFAYRLRTVTEPIRDETRPVPGFADLHVHQAAELAHGGNWYWGSHTGRASDALSGCGEIEGLGDLNPLRKVTGDRHAVPWDIDLGEGQIRHGDGAPVFGDWPHHADIAHQQVHADWLEQAHSGGLNLIVVSAVNNEPLCRILSLMYAGREAVCADMPNIKRQIAAFVDFSERHDWYEIALNPWHARQIIHDGKLAVVISLEASHLLPRSEGDFVKQLDGLYSMGLRSLQPVHETDSQFAGAAPHRGMFEVMQVIKWPLKTIESLFREHQGGFRYDADGKNVVGLSRDGEQLLDAMMQRRMLVDVSHMSEAGVKDVYDLVRKRYDSYPFYDSHTRFEALLDQDTLKHQREFLTTDRQIAMLKAVGGMVGLRTGADHILGAPGERVANTCAGSSRSFAQLMDYATRQGLDFAFGSDLNGTSHQVGPRFGPESCYANRRHDKGSREPQGRRPTTLSRDYQQRGLAHIGLMPDLVQDLRELDAPGVNRLTRSAETFLRMWEKAYDARIPAHSSSSRR